MSEHEQCFCPNEQCKDHGLRSQGNIRLRCKYGKDKSRDLLYCHTCGTRFAATQSSALFGLHIPAESIRQIIHHAAEGVGVRATARLLDLDKDTVNRVILRAGEHCANVLSGLLTSLSLTEVQLDELWTFVKKKKVLAVPKTLSTSTVGHGSGQR
jgi:transposase-like protein